MRYDWVWSGQHIILALMVWVLGSFVLISGDSPPSTQSYQGCLLDSALSRGFLSRPSDFRQDTLSLGVEQRRPSPHAWRFMGDINATVEITLTPDVNFQEPYMVLFADDGTCEALVGDSEYILATLPRSGQYAVLVTSQGGSIGSYSLRFFHITQETITDTPSPTLTDTPTLTSTPTLPSITPFTVTQTPTRVPTRPVSSATPLPIPEPPPSITDLSQNGLPVMGSGERTLMIPLRLTIGFNPGRDTLQVQAQVPPGWNSDIVDLGVVTDTVPRLFNLPIAFPESAWGQKFDLLVEAGIVRNNSFRPLAVVGVPIDLTSLALAVAATSELIAEQPLRMQVVLSVMNEASRPAEGVQIVIAEWPAIAELPTPPAFEPIEFLAPGATVTRDFTIPFIENEQDRDYQFIVLVSASNTPNLTRLPINIAVPALKAGPQIPETPWLGVALGAGWLGMFLANALLFFYWLAGTPSLNVVGRWPLTPQQKEAFQRQARPEKPEEPCSLNAFRCYFEKLEPQLGNYKIAGLEVSVFDPATNQSLKKLDLTGEISKTLNEALQRYALDKDKGRLYPKANEAARDTLRELYRWLGSTPVAHHLQLRMGLEGSKITFSFTLYQCRQRAGQRKWTPIKEWEAQLPHKKEEPVGVIHDFRADQTATYEQLLPILTNALMGAFDRI